MTSLYNKRLNPEQRAAVKHMLRGECRKVPYVLFGPPGTGKTTTLLETLLQMMDMPETRRVLICAPTNAAADHIASCLVKAALDLDKDPSEMLLRLCAFSRRIDSVAPNLLPNDQHDGVINYDMDTQEFFDPGGYVRVGFSLHIPVFVGLVVWLAFAFDQFLIPVLIGIAHAISSHAFVFCFALCFVWSCTVVDVVVVVVVGGGCGGASRAGRVGGVLPLHRGNVGASSQDVQQWSPHSLRRGGDR